MESANIERSDDVDVLHRLQARAIVHRLQMQWKGRKIPIEEAWRTVGAIDYRIWESIREILVKDEKPKTSKMEQVRTQKPKKTSAPEVFHIPAHIPTQLVAVTETIRDIVRSNQLENLFAEEKFQKQVDRLNDWKKASTNKQKAAFRKNIHSFIPELILQEMLQCIAIPENFGGNVHMFSHDSFFLGEYRLQSVSTQRPFNYWFSFVGTLQNYTSGEFDSLLRDESTKPNGLYCFDITTSRKKKKSERGFLTFRQSVLSARSPCYEPHKIHVYCHGDEGLSIDKKCEGIWKIHVPIQSYIEQTRQRFMKAIF